MKAAALNYAEIFIYPRLTFIILYRPIPATIMRERKVWTQYEDKILRYLREEQGEKKWSAIARKMEQEYAIFGRTGKQCRQRYHNHLDSAILTTQWNEQQDESLLTLQQEYGNKWSSISEKLPGRSDNCVKNRFYSKLRKSTRRINKFITDQLNSQYEEITPRLLSNLIETSELRFHPNAKVNEETIELSVSLKNRLYRFEKDFPEVIEEEQQIDTVRELIEGILSLERHNKKSKKTLKRTSSFELKPNFLLPPNRIKLNRSNSNSSKQSEPSDASEDFLSASFSSSSFSEYDQLAQVKNRRVRSMTTHSSKDVPSRGSSDMADQKKQTSIDSQRDKQKDTTTQLHFEFPNLERERPNNKSAIEESIGIGIGIRKYNGDSSPHSNHSSSNRSNNSQNHFKSFDAFCHLDQNKAFNWFPHPHQPLADASEIVWRIIEPKQPQNMKNENEEDDPIPCQQMEEEH